MHDANKPIKPATMTIRSACNYSGLGSSTLYIKIKEGALSTRKIGRRTLITTASLDAMLGVGQLGAA
jgi:excisionase family DNA binding protein